MRVLTILLLILIATPMIASEETSNDSNTQDLDNTLENARAVPYLNKDGKVEGYIVQEPEKQNVSNMKIRQGEVLTAPNTAETQNDASN